MQTRSEYEQQGPTKYRKTSNNNLSSATFVTFHIQEQNTTPFPTVEESTVRLKTKLYKVKKTYLSFCNEDGTIFIYDLEKEDPIQVIPSLGDIRALSFLSDFELVISYDRDHIDIWDIQKNKLTKSIPLTENIKLKLSEELLVVIGDKVIINQSESDVIIWDTTENKTTYFSKDYGAYDVKKYDDNHFVSCHDTNDIALWSINPLKLIKEIPTHQDFVFGADYWDKNQIIVGIDNRIKIYDLETDKVLYNEKIRGDRDEDELTEDPHEFKAISFIQKLDNDRVVVVHSGTVRAHWISIWNVKKKKMDATELTTTSSLSYRPVAIKENLLVYFEDGFINVYDSISGRVIQTIEAADAKEETSLAIW
jgi:WD40 repeat protein